MYFSMPRELKIGIFFMERNRPSGRRTCSSRTADRSSISRSPSAKNAAISGGKRSPACFPAISSFVIPRKVSAAWFEKTNVSPSTSLTKTMLGMLLTTE